MLEQRDNRQRCVVRVLVERLAPYKGRVYDPCCGSAGMFVPNEKFVEEHGGRRCFMTTHAAALEINDDSPLSICHE